MQNPKYLKRHPCLFIFFPKNAINARINKRTHTHTHTHERERDRQRERERNRSSAFQFLFLLFSVWIHESLFPLSTLLVVRERKKDYSNGNKRGC